MRSREGAVKEPSRIRLVTVALLSWQDAYGVSPEKVRGAGTGWLPLFHAIADELDESLMMVDMTVAGLPLIYANAAACRLTGYEREEMIGRNCRFLRHDHHCRFEDGKERTGPEVRAIRRSITEGRTATLKVLNYRKDGERLRGMNLGRPSGGPLDANLTALMTETPKGDVWLA